MSESAMEHETVLYLIFYRTIGHVIKLIIYHTSSNNGAVLEHRDSWWDILEWRYGHLKADTLEFAGGSWLNRIKATFVKQGKEWFVLMFVSDDLNNIALVLYSVLKWRVCLVLLA